MLIVEQLIACGLDKTEALEITEAINRILAQSPTACWYEISRYILTPQHPFALHQLLYETVYADFVIALPTDHHLPGFLRMKTLPKQISLV